MTNVLVDVRDFDPDGELADVTIHAARLVLSVSGSKLVSTASELVFDGTTNSFELEPDLLVRLTVEGVAGLVTPLWVEVPQTATSLADLYLNHRVHPITAQPLPQYPSIAAAIGDLAQQLADARAEWGGNVTTDIDPDGVTVLLIDNAVPGAALTTDPDGTPVLLIGA